MLASFPTAPSHGKQARNTASSSILSRRYTAPELARREGAEAAVLVLCMGDGGDFAIVMYLTTDRHMRRTYRQRLDAAAMAALLSRGRLDDTDPWGSRLCRWLAEVGCGALLVEPCRRNGLPLTVFTSLPEDVVVEILKRIGDGAALARAACTSRLMRSLVAAYDAELWKPLCETAAVCSRLRFWDRMLSLPELSECFNWKWRYKRALGLQQFLSRPIARTPLIEPNPRNTSEKRRKRCHPSVPLHVDDYGTKRQDSGDVHLPERIETGKSAEGHRHNVPRYDWNRKQRYVAGAIHSPSSRYRWNHR